MNCKPGDLAVIIGSGEKNPNSDGRFCEVLYASPIGCAHTLPNGVVTSGSNAASWVIKLSNPIMVLWNDGVVRAADYASCPDARLRPIRDPGDDAKDESHEWLPPVPTKEIA